MQLDRLLSELRQLPADAPEWEEFDGFVLRLRQVAKDKETERELRRQALRDALTQLLAERSAELAYSGKTDCSTWSADTCPYVLIAAITDQVHEFADTLRIHGEVRRRSAATFEEDQIRIRQLEDLQREIHSRHSVISEVLSGKAPTPGPGGGLPPRRSEPTTDRSSSTPSSQSGTKSRDSVVVEEIVSGPSQGPAVSREADSAASLETAGSTERNAASSPAPAAGRSETTRTGVVVPPATSAASDEPGIELDLSGWQTPATEHTLPQIRDIPADRPIAAAGHHFEIVIEEAELADSAELDVLTDPAPDVVSAEQILDEGADRDWESAPDIELDLSVDPGPSPAGRPIARINPPPFRPVIEPAPTASPRDDVGASSLPSDTSEVRTGEASTAAASGPAAGGLRPIKVEHRWVPPQESVETASDEGASAKDSHPPFVGILAGQPSVAPGAGPARSGESYTRVIGASPDPNTIFPADWVSVGLSNPEAPESLAEEPAAGGASEAGVSAPDADEPPIIELVEPLPATPVGVGPITPASAEDVAPGLSAAELRAVSDEIGEDVVLAPIELRSPRATPESIVYDDSSDRYSGKARSSTGSVPGLVSNREWGDPKSGDVGAELIRPTPVGVSNREPAAPLGRLDESPAVAASAPWAGEPIIVVEEFGSEPSADPTVPDVAVLLEPELEPEADVPVPIRLARQHLNRQAARRLHQADRQKNSGAGSHQASARPGSGGVATQSSGVDLGSISNDVGVPSATLEAPVSARSLIDDWAAERVDEPDDSHLSAAGANGRGHYPKPTQHSRPQVASFDAARAGQRTDRSREGGRRTPSRRGVLAVVAAVVIGALGVAGSLAWNQGSAPTKDLPDGSRLALEYVSTGTYHQFQLSNPLQQAVLSRLPGMLKAEPAVQTQSDAKVFWVHRSNRTDGADPSLYDHQIWPGRVVPSDSHGCAFDNLLYTGKKAVPGAAPAWPRRDATFPVALMTDQGEKVEFKVPGGGGRVDREWTPDAPGIVKPLGGLKLSLLSVDVGLKLQQIRGDALPVSNFIWRDFENVEASRASYPWIPSRENRTWNRAYFKIVGDRKAFDAWNLEGLNLSDVTGNELSFRMGSEALQSRLGADGKLWVAWPGGLCRQESAWKLRLRFDPAGGTVRPDVSISANAVSILSAGTARELATRSSGAGISLNELKVYADGSEFRDLIPGAGSDPIITVVTRLEESHGVHLEFRVRDAQGQLLPGQLYRIGGSLKAPKFAYMLQGAGATNNLTVSCAAWRTRPVDWYVSPKN